VAADPIYQLGPGPEYSPGTGAGTFRIPSVAEGIVFYLDPSDPPAEITLTGLFNTSGEKVWCIPVTRSTFACSAEGELQGNFGDNQDEGQANGQGWDGSGSLGYGPNDNDPIIQLVNGPADGPAALFQTANFGNDPPLGPASVPEPGSLILLANALLIFFVTTRRLQQSGWCRENNRGKLTR
jgi:hypothetical protein